MRQHPVLPAYLHNGQSYVWCDYCDLWHFHGTGSGHRSAHCIAKNSPYNNGGYIIEVIGNLDDFIREYIPTGEQVPEGFPVKGNSRTKTYHVPSGGQYNRVKADIYFATEKDAKARGFYKSKR